jgi:hypothetical protein
MMVHWRDSPLRCGPSSSVTALRLGAWLWPRSGLYENWLMSSPYFSRIRDVQGSSSLCPGRAGAPPDSPPLRLPQHIPVVIPMSLQSTVSPKKSCVGSAMQARIFRLTANRIGDQSTKNVHPRRLFQHGVQCKCAYGMLSQRR